MKDCTSDNELEEGETSEQQRPQRERKLTEKMAEYQEELLCKRQKCLDKSYETWKLTARDIRKSLKEDCSQIVLSDIANSLKDTEGRVLKAFEELRSSKSYITPEVVNHIDACVAVTADIMKIVNERLSEVEDYHREFEVQRLSALKENFCARSVFSSITERTNKSNVSEKLADAAAELAVKKAEYKHLLEEQKQKENILLLESKQRAALQEQYDSLKRLEVKRNVDVAQAKFSVYDHFMNIEEACDVDKKPIQWECSLKDPKVNDNATKIDNSEMCSSKCKENNVINSEALARVLAESINLNRLPVPEPHVFSGDALQYIEWKTSFHTLIERKGVPPEEKIFYLKKYTGGPARKALEGFFYSNNKSAFESAKRVLDERYGHPFVVQRAFRDKLEKWPKIAPRDHIGLRDFSDFLRGCRDAIPHISNLSILNDCNENQKLVCKLPDWASVRWNREVTLKLASTGEYPLFSEFVEFVMKEATVACNPITALHAISSKDTRMNKSTGSVKALATNSSNFDESRSDNTAKTVLCEFCNTDNHYIIKCEQFLLLTLNQKRDVIRNKNLCFGCLRKGHRNKDCRRKHTCSICRKKHPTCLHEDRSSASQQVTWEPREQRIINNSVTTPGSSFNTSMIVPVWVSSLENPSREILTYAMLDTQSDTTFILDDTVAALELKGQKVKLSLSTMTSQNTHIESSRITSLKVRAFNTTDHVIVKRAYTRDFIPVDRLHIPQSETVKGWSHLASISDQIQPLQSCEVGLLIGYNCPQALAPRKVIIGNNEEPYAVQTLLGWSVIGCARDSNDKIGVIGSCHRTMVQAKEIPVCSPSDVIKALERDFANDSDKFGKVSQNDIRFLNILDNNIRVREDRHLEMPLPFKQRPMLPNNKHMAILRLKHLKRKMSDSRYYDHYKQFMKGIFERGEAEPVIDNGVEGNVWYIPHHGVYHAHKPNKIRVVFDCSARYANTSLNQHLLTGPDLTNNLVGVLCRVREHPVAIMCDIEGMFHQFSVKEDDRNFLRFLWWEDGDINKRLLEYRMTVHLFGAASSPGCANYGLKYVARNHKNDFPQASLFVQNDFYVDDGLTSLETEEEAIQLVKDARILCAAGGLRLHKFLSNNKAVIESIPVTERAPEVKYLNLSLDKLPVERALGMKWCLESDIFKFDANIDQRKATRRNILSIVASVFDPLGFLSPFTLKGKRLLQETCQKGIDWDDPIPESVQLAWEQWVRDLQNLPIIQIPRPLRPATFEKSLRIELHHFSDASSSGYGQCSYIRFIGESNIHCALVIAKARVAPHKVVSIPRLELTAAVLSVKMSTFLREELTLQIDEEYFWTDSRVVLGYINNEARRFHVFVANRVQMIRDSTRPNQWYYVSSEDNPADHASRGLSVTGIASSTWLEGPSFLWKRELCVKSVSTELQLGDPEVKCVRLLCTESKSFSSILERLERFSNWSKLVAVIARLQRLSNGVKGKHFSSSKERQIAIRTLLKLVQDGAFRNTINTIKRYGKLSNTDPLYPLDPMLYDGLLRVGGRLKKADMSECYRHPVILPNNCHITTLILGHVHQEVLHQGRGITLNKLRLSGYWIIGGSKTVAKFIRGCVICRRLRRPTECQKMADLPAERVVPSPPFTYCGMDCFGPFTIKQGRKEVKRYGLLFTCMCCRAIHIEILDDMSTDAFINALRCFIALRGAVKQIRSDQGTNFVGAKNELEREITVNKLSKYLAEKQCEFIMNVPNASHTGGVWERQIKTIRSILSAVLLLCPSRLDDSSLRTVFYEAMSIVNSRPLSVSEIDNPDVVEPLTPNHILTAKSHVPGPPPGNFVKEDLFLRKRWRRVQYLLEQFWTRWRREYISQISLRQKWHERRRNIRVGDVVLVKDIDLPRNQWPLAIVVEVTVDDDGLVRRTKVKLGQKGSSSASVLERSVHKLVLLLEH